MYKKSSRHSKIVIGLGAEGARRVECNYCRDRGPAVLVLVFSRAGRNNFEKITSYGRKKRENISSVRRKSTKQ